MIIFFSAIVSKESIKEKLNHVYHCESCRLFWFGKNVINGTHKKNGKRVCIKCGKLIVDITFTELGEQLSAMLGMKEEKKNDANSESKVPVRELGTNQDT